MPVFRFFRLYIVDYDEHLSGAVYNWLVHSQREKRYKERNGRKEGRVRLGIMTCNKGENTIDAAQPI